MRPLGRILHIDLTNQSWKFSPFPEDIAKKFLAGRGFNVHFLSRFLPPETDPMSPSNILLFTCGLLTGTEAPASSRLHISAHSPLTGLLGSSNVGGDFGAVLRQNGIQSLIIKGRASKPTTLLVKANSVSFLDAETLWGSDTWETQDRLKQKYGGDSVKALTIGPGGENGVLFGCIMSDRDHAAGRTGMGTVMGSKNLKTIVIKRPGKSRQNRIPDRDREAIQRYVHLITHSPQYQTVSTHGGAGYINWANELGILSTKNYRENRFEAADALDGKHLTKYVSKYRSCHRCPIHCKAVLKLNNGNGGSTEAVRPEFESILALGSKCGLRDLKTLIHLDNLCSKMGIDSMSTGGVIAFAMDLFERGILTTEDTEGIELTWGNASAMETLILQMVQQEGLGAILSQGVRRAAHIIGRGAERYAPHVKGLEMAGYHPYHIMGTALGYTVASRGADFNDVYATLEYKWLPEKASEVFGTPKAADLKSIQGKAELVRRARIVGTVLDSLGLCKVPALCLICAFDLKMEAELTAAVSEASVSVEDLFSSGERTLNLERLFNIRYGAGVADDRLPDMFFQKDYNSGEVPSQPAQWMEPMKKEFYAIMGWDENGIPKHEKLMELDIRPTENYPVVS
ncbi:MAG: aldehyde ferredoxin oxidoreductase family protein [Deltaproteobacteria bacterium]|nr:aldehyde ferredoxin oxidoreductase family protein [Deltaproteobacteria bacterium]